MSSGTDVLVVSLGTTLGWRLADEVFLGQLERAGVSTAVVSMRFGAAGKLRRGYPLNDFVEMHAARRATIAAVRERRPRAVVLSSTTAAMLSPRLDVPYAVRLDAPAAMNRPGALCAPVRLLERRGLGRARLTLPMSEAARAALPDTAAPAVVVPPPVEPSGPGPVARGRLAVAYVPDPKAKGLDVLAAAWAAARPPDATLEVYGLDPRWARSYLGDAGLDEPPGMKLMGTVPRERFRARVREAHAYVGGARWEDFGQAPLEALADGTLLVTVPSGGPFEALRLARQLDSSLVAPAIAPDGLAAAIRTALELPEERVRAYRARALELLAPLRADAVQATVAGEVVPALLAGG